MLVQVVSRVAVLVALPDNNSSMSIQLDVSQASSLHRLAAPNITFYSSHLASKLYKIMYKICTE